MIEDIINQLKSVLPKYTNDFTANLNVISLTRDGNIITCETEDSHNLSINDKALITNAKTPILIDSLTRIENYAIALTATPHELRNGDKSTEIIGADQSDYNGIKKLIWDYPTFEIESITISGNIATVTTRKDHGFLIDPRFEVRINGVKQQSYNKKITILSIPASNVFTCNIIGVFQDAEAEFGKVMTVRQEFNPSSFIFAVENEPITPATGIIYQATIKQDGYNGYKNILSVPTPTSFTYAIETEPLSPALGEIKVKINPNISFAIDLERMLKHFESNVLVSNAKNWIYYIPDNGKTSRDKSMINDAIASVGSGQYTRLVRIKTFYLYVFIKTTNEKLFYSDAAQKSQEYITYLTKTLVGFRPKSPFVDQYYRGIAFDEDAPGGIHGQYYIHRYSFETYNYLTYEDQVELPDSVPFRELNIDYLDKNKNIFAEFKIDL